MKIFNDRAVALFCATLTNSKAEDVIATARLYEEYLTGGVEKPVDKKIVQLSKETTYNLIRAHGTSQIKDIVMGYAKLGITTFHRKVGIHFKELVDDRLIYPVDPEITRDRKYNAYEDISWQQNQ